LVGPCQLHLQIQPGDPFLSTTVLEEHFQQEGPQTDTAKAK